MTQVYTIFLSNGHENPVVEDGKDGEVRKKGNDCGPQLKNFSFERHRKRTLAQSCEVFVCLFELGEQRVCSQPDTNYLKGKVI